MPASFDQITENGMVIQYKSKMLTTYRVRVMVFNAHFNNISVISWRSCLHIQSNLSYVTFQFNIEIESHKTGWMLNTDLINMKCTVKGN